MEHRLVQIEESVARYLSQLDTANRQRAVGRHWRPNGASEGEDRQACERG